MTFKLRNVLERLAITVSSETIGVRNLEFLTTGGAVPLETRKKMERPERLLEARDRFERDYIVRALAVQRGNISRAAEVFGIERSNFYRKMRTFGITSPRQPVSRSMDGIRETSGSGRAEGRGADRV